MDHFLRIYSQRAVDYQRMISAEDADGNLSRAFEALGGLQGKRLLDLGSGTGRLPALLHAQARHVVALDLHAAMLAENKRVRSGCGGRWDLVQGDLRRLPFSDECADMTAAGWAAGHFCSWYPNRWKEQISTSLQEMLRVTVPGGRIVILETLGTGRDRPAAPSPELETYYRWLEADWGFSRHVLSTDYQFPSVEDAVQHTEFFFGAELAEQIRARRWKRVPEWTGLWARYR